ncbi:NAD(P)-binding protein [Streptomyces paludis]|uniref:NAD(P)/FAD-dependent oxidoreductase n=1 Tax=Streptomyces paludis TaxID=2282738 RepID=A0A345HRU0_9ACTN|nr:NAD(P)-binding protein [Streptomyces paludis]AXG79414.1 NAD(P)/FAD-dependent oxidoreductase [Streptomyces paludis]
MEPSRPNPNPNPASTGATTPTITVIGGGLAGLTAAITAAESGAAPVTLYEGHRTLGGRARTATVRVPGATAPYRTNDGPHALYIKGPHAAWLRQRGLLGTIAGLPLRPGGPFIRFHLNGTLHAVPPRGLLTLPRRTAEHAPVDTDFLTWATAKAGPAAARAAAHYSAVALYHHDPGSLSAAFVQERLHRAAALSPEARYPVGGWGALVDRMASYAEQLGVRIETGVRIDDLPAHSAEDAPVIVATTLDAARRLLKEDDENDTSGQSAGNSSLRQPGGRTVLLDLALRTRAGDPFIISDLDAPGWLERFSAADPSLAPAGEQLVQGQFPLAPDQRRSDGVARAEHLLDLGFRGWRERTVWRRDALSDNRTGAVDLPGSTWRDRPRIDRGHGVYLAGDSVAAPGVLSEVSFNSGIEAATLAVRRLRGVATRVGTEGNKGRGLDLNNA